MFSIKISGTESLQNDTPRKSTHKTLENCQRQFETSNGPKKIWKKNGQHFPCFLSENSRIESHQKLFSKNRQHSPVFETSNHRGDSVWTQKYLKKRAAFPPVFYQRTLESNHFKNSFEKMDSISMFLKHRIIGMFLKHRIIGVDPKIFEKKRAAFPPVFYQKILESNHIKNYFQKIDSILLFLKHRIIGMDPKIFEKKTGSISPCFLSENSRIESLQKFFWKNGQHFPVFETSNHRNVFETSNHRYGPKNIWKKRAAFPPVLYQKILESNHIKNYSKKMDSILLFLKHRIVGMDPKIFEKKTGSISPCFLSENSRIESLQKFFWKNGQHFHVFERSNGPKNIWKKNWRRNWAAFSPVLMINL